MSIWDELDKEQKDTVIDFGVGLFALLFHIIFWGYLLIIAAQDKFGW